MMRIGSEIEEKIGYVFNAPELLLTALTHSSAHGQTSNERMEFLGDAVLELCASEFLYRTYADKPEGVLTRMRADLVCEASLCAWSKRIGAGAFLRLGKSEEQNGGREKSSILADTAEAVLGAVYLDGGLEAAKELSQKMLAYIMQARRSMLFVLDSKTELQQILQRTGAADIEYDIISEVGPPHDRTFYVRLKANGKELSTGCGRSKKQAEQSAAQAALKILEDNKGEL